MAKEIDNDDKRSRARLPLNRDRIFAAAVEIADERGVGSVTMREVASRLRVEAMSLYNHVANKDDILDGMVDMVIDQFDLPEDTDHWREAMRHRAISAHKLFALHPWVPPLLDSRKSSGPSRLRYFEWVLKTLFQAGFSLTGAGRAFSLLDSYIYGFSIQQLNATADGDTSPEEMAAAILESIPAEKYPNLHRMAMNSMLNGYDVEADFAFGLELILEGLEQILKASKTG
jgi:AcrR family transcriptional regulator